MSGNHKFTGRSAEKTKLEQVCQEKFMENYGSNPVTPEGWYSKYVVRNSENENRMSSIIWQVYERAFYDGFATKLSGVKDENETLDTTTPS